MVRAILEGRKTQTRRVVKLERWMGKKGMQLEGAVYDPGIGGGGYLKVENKGDGTRHRLRCPYGSIGDKLWVRETWKYFDWSEDGEPMIKLKADGRSMWPEVPEEWQERVEDVWATLSDPDNYLKANAARDQKWRPGIHMPRWASRIMLEITDIRAERLHSLSEIDAKAEGMQFYDGHGVGHSGWRHDVNYGEVALTARGAFHALWHLLNGRESWDANPFIWVIEFKAVIK